MNLIKTLNGDIEQSEVVGDLPSRDFRDAWVLNGNAVELDPTIKADILREKVNVERDRRLNLGVMFNGKLFQSDAVSKQRLLGVSLQATLAIINGAQANDLRWADPNNDFTYISADNTAVALDAPDTIALGQAVAAYEKLIVYKARALKDAPGGPPDNYADDSHWT